MTGENVASARISARALLLSVACASTMFGILAYFISPYFLGLYAVHRASQASTEFEAKSWLVRLDDIGQPPVKRLLDVVRGDGPLALRRAAAQVLFVRCSELEPTDQIGSEVHDWKIVMYSHAIAAEMGSRSDLLALADMCRKYSSDNEKLQLAIRLLGRWRPREYYDICTELLDGDSAREYAARSISSALAERWSQDEQRTFSEFGGSEAFKNMGLSRQIDFAAFLESSWLRHRLEFSGIEEIDMGSDNRVITQSDSDVGRRLRLVSSFAVGTLLFFFGGAVVVVARGRNRVIGGPPERKSEHEPQG